MAEAGNSDKTSPNAGALCPIRWNDNRLYLLDQRKLPAEVVWLALDTAPATAEAITNMVVRGAPAIGFTAAFGVVLSAQQHANAENWRESIAADIEKLARARPTAVNLRWSLDRMQDIVVKASSVPTDLLLEEAQSQLINDREQNLQMGGFGADRIAAGSKVMTHCNAGALATAGYGTALAVLRVGWSRGLIDTIYASETRPWLQGSRLTAWELAQDQIPVTLLTDSAAAQAMRGDGIDWLVVGADRIAANGDVANKIGTYSHAVTARFHGAKVMVVAPHSTIDMETESGASIPIEGRSGDEIWRATGSKDQPKGVTISNPGFDITPFDLVDLIVTEKGVFEAPYDSAFRAVS